MTDLSNQQYSSDKKLQKKQLNKSRTHYENKQYHTRKKVKSFKSKPSNHIQNAKEILIFFQGGTTQRLFLSFCSRCRRGGGPG